METTYEWLPVVGAATRMTLRNRGEPSGFAGVAAPILSAAMRRAKPRTSLGSKASSNPADLVLRPTVTCGAMRSRRCWWVSEVGGGYEAGVGVEGIAVEVGDGGAGCLAEVRPAVKWTLSRREPSVM